MPSICPIRILGKILGAKICASRTTHLTKAASHPITTQKCFLVHLHQRCYAQSSLHPSNILPRLLLLPLTNPQHLGQADRIRRPRSSRADGLRRYIHPASIPSLVFILASGHADLRPTKPSAKSLTFPPFPTSRPKSLLPPQPPHQMDSPRRRHRRFRHLSYALERAARR